MRKGLTTSTLFRVLVRTEFVAPAALPVGSYLGSGVFPHWVLCGLSESSGVVRLSPRPRLSVRLPSVRMEMPPAADAWVFSDDPGVRVGSVFCGKANTSVGRRSVSRALQDLPSGAWTKRPEEQLVTVCLATSPVIALTLANCREAAQPKPWWIPFQAVCRRLKSNNLGRKVTSSIS